jgi:outer membrane biosynthesis protein TonB
MQPPVERESGVVREPVVQRFGGHLPVDPERGLNLKGRQGPPPIESGSEPVFRWVNRNIKPICVCLVAANAAVWTAGAANTTLTSAAPEQVEQVEASPSPSEVVVASEVPVREAEFGPVEMPELDPPVWQAPDPEPDPAPAPEPKPTPPSDVDPQPDPEPTPEPEPEPTLKPKPKPPVDPPGQGGGPPDDQDPPQPQDPEAPEEPEDPAPQLTEVGRDDAGS